MLEINGNNYTFDINRTVTLTDKDIDDIMSIALDGDMTSEWAYKVKPISGHFLGEYASEQISRGGALRFYVYEDPNKYILNLETLIKGIQLAMSKEFGGDWFDDNGKNFNSSAVFNSVQADIVLQFALFGDVVYS